MHFVVSMSIPLNSTLPAEVSGDRAIWADAVPPASRTLPAVPATFRKFRLLMVISLPSRGIRVTWPCRRESRPLVELYLIVYCIQYISPGGGVWKIQTVVEWIPGQGAEKSVLRIGGGRRTTGRCN